MRNYIVLLIALTLFSCTAREEVIEKSFPNGNKQIVLVYEGKDDERKLMEQKGYYVTGQLEVTGQFDENKKRTGNWVYYYENGVKWSECEYINGLRDGKSITYYEDGTKRYEGTFALEKQTGHWTFYKPDGSIQDEKDY
ncbi:hypothetical protein N9R81_04770 [Flavobacteriales bacterium]|nr:hypothetical protein [Flavobacteriales bacterium]